MEPPAYTHGMKHEHDDRHRNRQYNGQGNRYRRRRGLFTPRLVFGLLFIFVGAVFMLERAGYIEEPMDLLRFWPVILMVAGTGKILRPGSSSGRISGLVLLLVGGAFLLDELGLLRWDVWDLWPLFLVLLGLRLVWQGLTGRRSVAADSSTTVTAAAALGGSSRRSNTADFRGGDLLAFMGGCDLDLREAQIQNSPAVIDVFAFWGGVDIRVPETWVVTVEGIALLGAFEDSTTTAYVQEGFEPQQELVVKGLAVMGGVEIKN